MIDRTEKLQQVPLFVACGMYAFTDDLRKAWQNLFNYYFDLAKPAFQIERLLKFETGQEILNNSSLWFGHTCGYPLMTHLQDTLTPICVPVFDVNGCDDIYYSSLLMVPENSRINSIQESKGLRAVINTCDSNSGMNVLRHSVAPFNDGGSFFKEIQISGSHLQSLTEIANQKADIAAIDCVSYRFIEDRWPELTARVKSIGFTEKTCGLPFVMPKLTAGNIDLSGITKNLNQALSMMDADQRNSFHLREFVDVKLGDYQGVLDLEVSAQEAGYPILA